MAGKNPEPSVTMDILEVIRDHLERVPGAVAEGVTRANREVIAAQSATECESFSRQLPAPGSQPVILVGADRQRTRMLVRGSTTDIFIGSLSQLNSGFGYPIPTQAGDEIKVVGDIYVVYNPSGAADPAPRVAVWIERNV